MAKTKTKTKSKFDFKQFLLAKGEYVAMGVAGFFLLLLMIWGVSKGFSASPSTDTVKALNDGAQRTQSNIVQGEPSEADLEAAKLPSWVSGRFEFRQAPESAFRLTNPQFDPTAKPDTKKENPFVLPIEQDAYQIDLTRGAMKGWDIITDGKDELIAVIFDKKIDPLDKGKMDKLRKNTQKHRELARPSLMGQFPMGQPILGQPPMGQPPMGQPPMGQPPMGQPPMGGGPGGPGALGKMRGGGNPYGGNSGFEVSAQRVEKAIEYVTFSQLDKALEKQKVPAMTVIPLRMITIHAEIPLKKQIDELRRALRLPIKDKNNPNAIDEAAKWGPIYDGYEIKRRVTRILPDGTVYVLEDWSLYNFEDEYRTRIRARRLADNFDEGYLGYFIRYEMALALPLPQMVPELGKYPPIRLKNILETIKKLEAAQKPEIKPSDLAKQVSGDVPRPDLFRPQTGADTGASDSFGKENVGGPHFGDAPPMPLSGGTGMRPGTASSNIPVEIEQLLLRFVDANVEPGKTYEYQIRLRMRNPNYKLSKEVSTPTDADVEFLYSPWRQLNVAITVPTESFLYAADWSGYYKKVKEEYGEAKEKALYERLQVQPNQAVVEACTWMTQVKTGDGGKREPIGAWVVADFPVARGEYIGRKHYVKLPLWSSENKAYILREIPDKVIPTRPGGPKDPPQPRGWLMDFTDNKSILVDFEGGKVRTKAGGKDVTEEASSELLVLRGDGKLVVKSSADDENDINRKEIVGDWEKWVKEVATRKASGSGEENPFGRPPGPGN